MSLRDYSLGLIGILPGTVFFVALGDLASDLASFSDVVSGRAKLLSWVLRFIGLLATVAVFWLVGRAARNALQSEDLPDKFS